MSRVFSTIQKYFSFFRIKFIAGLQYRAAAIAGIATQFAWGSLEILVYEAFWRTDPSKFPMERFSLYTYIWLQQALLSMFMLWMFDMEIFSDISSGKVAVDLCRPIDIYSMWFAKNCSLRLSRVVLRCFPIFIVASLLPEPFKFRLPNSITALLLSSFSLIVGFLVLISISMLVYISSFYTIDSRGTRLFIATIGEFCAGGVIPLPFLPENVKNILNLLPFASTQSVPFLIFGGSMTESEAYKAIGIQIFWAFSLITIGRMWMKISLRKVILQGG